MKNSFSPIFVPQGHVLPNLGIVDKIASEVEEVPSKYINPILKLTGYDSASTFAVEKAAQIFAPALVAPLLMAAMPGGLLIELALTCGVGAVLSDVGNGIVSGTDESGMGLAERAVHGCEAGLMAGVTHLIGLDFITQCADGLNFLSGLSDKWKGMTESEKKIIYLLVVAALGLLVFGGLGVGAFLWNRKGKVDKNRVDDPMYGGGGGNQNATIKLNKVNLPPSSTPDVSPDGVEIEPPSYNAHVAIRPEIKMTDPNSFSPPEINIPETVIPFRQNVKEYMPDAIAIQLLPHTTSPELLSVIADGATVGPAHVRVTTDFKVNESPVSNNGSHGQPDIDESERDSPVLVVDDAGDATAYALD